MNKKDNNNSNVLTPFIELLWESGKAVGNLAFGISGKIDWAKEFEYLSLENKDNVKPRLIKTQEDKYYKRFIFSLPKGLSVKDFEKHLDRFATIFKMGENYKTLLRVTRYQGNAMLVVDKDTFNKEVFPYSDLSKNYKVSPTPDLRIPLGYYIGDDWELHLLYVNLADANTPHFSTAGTTGSGKTNVIKLLLTHLFRVNSPENFTASLSDLKGTELPEFANLPHVKHYTDDAERTCEIIDEVLALMEARYSLLKETGCKDIEAYLERGHKMSYHLLLIDEFPELSILADSKYCEEVDSDVIAKLRRLLNKGRACGIIVGLSSQTNKATTLPTELRSNIPLTIGLRARDEAHSIGICGVSGLQDLRSTGMSNIYGLVDRPYYTIRTLYMPKHAEELLELIPEEAQTTKVVKEQTLSSKVQATHENVKTVSGFDLNKEELFRRFRGIEEDTTKRKPRHRNSKKQSDLANKLDNLK